MITSFSFLNFAIATLVLWTCSLVSASFVRLELFQHGRCSGWKHSADLNRQCYGFPRLENEISGARMTAGSCAKIFKSRRGCNQADSFLIKYPNDDYCVLPCCGFNDNVKSVSSCRTHTRTIQCPNGSYIREIGFGRANETIRISCFRPTETQANYIRNTHDLSSQPRNSVRCPIAALGLKAVWNNRWRMWEHPKLSCQRLNGGSSSNEPDETRIELKPRGSIFGYANGESINGDCERHMALVGVSVVIDEANVIKKITNICRRVPNPALMCEPRENLVTVVYCNNLLSGNELECTFKRTIGVGVTRTMTETLRRQEQFNVEVGYQIGTTTQTLSQSMTRKLGNSSLADYQWSTSDSTTWTKMDTVSATIKVRPYTFSVLRQLTATCSFYGVHTNFFQQADLDETGTAEKTLRNLHF